MQQLRRSYGVHPWGVQCLVYVMCKNSTDNVTKQQDELFFPRWLHSDPLKTDAAMRGLSLSSTRMTVQIITSNAH